MKNAFCLTWKAFSEFHLNIAWYRRKSYIFWCNSVKWLEVAFVKWFLCNSYYTKMTGKSSFIETIGNTSVHYQVISHTDNQNLQFLLTPKMLSKITNKLITEVHRVQQKQIQTDRKGWNICFTSMMVYLSL